MPALRIRQLVGGNPQALKVFALADLARMSRLLI
jgi:hypothetical protein